MLLLLQLPLLFTHQVEAKRARRLADDRQQFALSRKPAVNEQIINKTIVFHWPNNWLQPPPYNVAASNTLERHAATIVQRPEQPTVSKHRWPASQLANWPTGQLANCSTARLLNWPTA